MNIRQFKHARKLHQVIGLISAVFFIILAVTGILLMHYDNLGLSGKVVNGRFLPEKYFVIDSQEPAIQALAASRKGTFYAGTAHGLFRSDNGGGSWTDLKQGLFSQDIRALTLDPAKPRVVYAGTSRGLFRSDDGGDTFGDWFDAASGLASGEINAIAVHPTDGDTIYAATAEGLFVTDDGGDSWSLAFKPPGQPGVRGIVFSVSDPDNTLYALAENGTHRSLDGGRTWQRVWDKALPRVTALVSLRADPEFLYAATESGLFKSFNEGRNWLKDSHRNFENPSALLSSAADISRLTLATDNGVFTTRDGGDSWKAAAAFPKHPDRLTALASDGKTLLVGSTLGLFVSKDHGKSWLTASLTGSAHAAAREDRRMDLVKLITEIHTGRFFGNYFMLLIDIATMGLVALVVSGVMITIYRKRVKARKKVSDELAADREIELQETASDLSTESLAIHDMIEHIGNHLDKCKSVYLTREKKEIDEIDRHITTLDKKVHHLMERINELDNISTKGD